MSIDIGGLSVAQLEKLIDDARARIDSLKKQQFVDLRRRLEAEAREAGFSIEELFSGRAPRAAVAKREVAPKYRNPHNGSQTWTGRGKQPIWVRDALASGVKLEDLLIK